MLVEKLYFVYMIINVEVIKKELVWDVMEIYVGERGEFNLVWKVIESFLNKVI